MSMSTEALLLELRAILERCWTEGCPVAAPPHDELARTALRRWRSFPRRHRGEPRAARLEDLAKGLCTALEPERRAVGRLMTDYRWLAEQLAAVLDAAPE